MSFIWTSCCVHANITYKLKKKKISCILQCCLGWKHTGCSGGSQERSVHITELKADESWEKKERKNKDWI